MKSTMKSTIIATLCLALVGPANAFMDYTDMAKRKAQADCLLGRAEPGFVQPGEKLGEICDFYYDKVIKPQGEECLASTAHKLNDPDSGKVLSFDGKELRFTSTNAYGGRVQSRVMCSKNSSGKMIRDRNLEYPDIRQEAADHRQLGIYLTLEQAAKKAGFLAWP